MSLRITASFALAGVLVQAQSGCPAVTFQGAASANLKPSSTTHIKLLKQTDSSYSAFELSDAAPYRIVRATRNFQKQLTGCPGIPVQGFLPGTEPPEAIARLSSGGYLWAHRAGFSLVATEFDSALGFISETQISNTPAEALTIADVNGDGVPDILTGTPFAHNNALQVFLGTGGSSFQPVVTYPIPSSPFAVGQVEVIDLNGDGKLDAVVVNSGKVSVFLGNGDGTFQTERTPFTGACSAAAIGDFNRDGKLDVACTREDTILAVELGVGGGALGPPTTYTVAWGDSIAAADMDGDGNLDLVTSGYSILFGDGTGRFPRRDDYWQEMTGRIVLTDFDGDGKLDIVTGMGSASGFVGPAISVMFGRGGGKFSGPPITLVQSLPAPNDSVQSLSPTDFDGDGIPDLLVQDLFEIGVLKGIGDGTFRQTFTYTAANGYPRATAVADFNRDSRPDIVVALTPGVGVGRIEVLPGKGDGTFQAPIATPAPAELSALQVGDFNGDGRPDVAGLLALSGMESVLVFLGDGAGGFAAPVSYATGITPNAIALGDFNGDGKLDMAIACSGDARTAGNVGGGLFIYLGKGDGTFNPRVSVPLGNPQVNGVVAADFDRDRFMDLAAVVGGNLTVLLGRGDGTFRAPLTFSNSASITGGYRYLAADLNGDGIPDLIRTDGAIWRLGNGDGTFQPEVLFATAAYPLFTSTAAADFNRDGELDLAGGLFTTGVATLLNLSQPAPLTVVNAASFATDPLAPNSIATAFGNFGNVAIVGVGEAQASILYSDPHQVNFVIPALPAGMTTVSVAGSANSVSETIQLVPVAPAIFTLNAAGLAAAYVVRVRNGVQTIETVDHPIDLGPPGDQAFLSLFGTGMRGAPTGQVTVRIQGIDAPVLFAGAQGQFPGLDQVNVLLPRELAGTGDANVVLTAAGADALTVHVSIQ
jgi:uncharacterized protein (TIGR03437 family)